MPPHKLLYNSTTASDNLFGWGGVFFPFPYPVNSFGVLILHGRVELDPHFSDQKLRRCSEILETMQLATKIQLDNLHMMNVFAVVCYVLLAW